MTFSHNKSPEKIKVEFFAMTNMENDDVNEDESRTTLPTHTPAATTPESCDSCGREASALTPAKPTKNDVVVVVCAGCEKPIYDKYYMWVDKRSWHEACVQCNVCERPLVKTCYTKNFKLYCQKDYKQLQKCQRCFKAVFSDELILRAGGHTYHVTCFVCDFCHQQLQPGNQYLIDDSSNQVYCKICYDQREERINTHFAQDGDSGCDSERSDDEVFSQHPMHLHNLGQISGLVQSGDLPAHQGIMRRNSQSKSSPSLTMMPASADGRRIKRPRTILTTNQRRKFKASFEVSQKPCRKVRETLAAETGLSPRVVQVWFQNQRAKMKKLARRQQGDGSGPGSCRGGNRIRRKKTAESDSDNDISSPDGSYVSMPTPHQNSLYHDSYRSPGSIQTSPTASEAHTYFSAAHSTTHEAADLPYDDFGQSLFSQNPSNDRFLAHSSSQSVTPTGQTQSISLDATLRMEMTETISDFNGHSGVMSHDGESLTETSPHESFTTFESSQPVSPFPVASTIDGNPIDRLMYMQNNFFRT